MIPRPRLVRKLLGPKVSADDPGQVAALREQFRLLDIEARIQKPENRLPRKEKGTDPQPYLIFAY